MTPEQIAAARALVDEAPKYLIWKQGAYYRPNSQGYTTSAIQAGRYTLADADSITHPNGPDGPRDGMGYVHEDKVIDADWQAYQAMTARAEAAEARSADLTAKMKAMREALKPFADIGIGSDPDYQPTIRMDRATIVTARNAVEMTGASTPAKINWRDDPIAFVEDDEHMNGRDYE